MTSRNSNFYLSSIYSKSKRPLWLTDCSRETHYVFINNSPCNFLTTTSFRLATFWRKHTIVFGNIALCNRFVTSGYEISRFTLDDYFRNKRLWKETLSLSNETFLYVSEQTSVNYFKYIFLRSIIQCFYFKTIHPE